MTDTQPAPQRHFKDARLGGASFENVDLSGSRFHHVDLRGADIRGVDLSGSSLKDVDLIDVRIDGDIDGLVVNGVDVGPMVEAELDRRQPGRVKMRPSDPAGFREAWDLLEQLWAGTVEKARRLPPERLHEQVAGEWSFIETLRHLAFATDAWVRRAIEGDPSPWHPLDLPWDQMPDTSGIPRDRDARPTLEEALALRQDRAATVRRIVDGLTDEQLGSDTRPVEGAGWPPPRSFPVRECLLTVLNEEWQHRLYAERDLDALLAS
ncbi:DinB family protein [Nocardioides sp. LHG3406-4]|uniref:DinB family protein n=1 Tax=Nocardioides sp. LHG3406-4 TaxID=2804575 RepID=UPI003CEB0A9B